MPRSQLRHPFILSEKGSSTPCCGVFCLKGCFLQAFRGKGVPNTFLWFVFLSGCFQHRFLVMGVHNTTLWLRVTHSLPFTSAAPLRMKEWLAVHTAQKMITHHLTHTVSSGLLSLSIATSSVVKKLNDNWGDRVRGRLAQLKLIKSYVSKNQKTWGSSH